MSAAEMSYIRKIHGGGGGGGDFVHVYENEQGGFCPGGGGILSYTQKIMLCRLV